MILYDEFRRHYDAVMSACVAARLSLEGLENEIERLSDLRDDLPLGADRTRAGNEIADLEDVLELARQTPYTDTASYQRASLALSRATDESGGIADRIARAQRGIDEIRSIAEGATDGNERFAVQRLTEPLEMLIGNLRSS